MAEPPSPIDIDRRAFLKSVARTAFLIFSLLSLSVAGLLLYPSRIKKKSVSFIYAGAADALPVRGVRQVYLEYSVNDTPATVKVFLVNTGAELFALSPVCTHLGCLVTWHRTKKRFLCPCHGGQYDMNGNVVEGPPPAPLNRLPMKIEGEKVYIGLRI